MAQKKRRQSAKQTSLNRRYGSVIGGITKQLKQFEREGFEVIGDIYPTRPKKITEASIREARKFSTGLKERAFYIDPESGEAFGVHDLVPHTAVNSKIKEARKVQGMPLTTKFTNAMWKEEMTHNARVNAEIEKAQIQRNKRQQKTRSPAQLANDARLRNKWRAYRVQKESDIDNYFHGGELKERSRKAIEKEAQRRGFFIDDEGELQPFDESKEDTLKRIQKEIDDEVERMKQEEEEDRGNYGEDSSDYDGEFWLDQNEDEEEDWEQDSLFGTPDDEDTYDPEADYLREKERAEEAEKQRKEEYFKHLRKLADEERKQRDKEWANRQSAQPVSETDTVLGNIEDLLSNYKPSDGWSKDLRNKKEQDKMNIKETLDNAIDKHGRDKVAKTLQDAGYQVANMIEEALYAYGTSRFGFADARGKVSHDIVQFQNILNNPSLDDIKIASDIMSYDEYDDSTDDNYDDVYSFDEYDDE